MIALWSLLLALEPGTPDGPSATTQEPVPAIEEEQAIEVPALQAPAAPVFEAAAPTTSLRTVTVDWGVQVRPRLEKSFGGNIGVPREISGLQDVGSYRTTQRTRGILNLEGELWSAKLSLQDVRTWAAEAGTASGLSTGSFDAHEGWLQLGVDDAIRVGRQEIIIDDQRLIGNLDWTNQGRAFDAIMLWHGRQSYKLTLVASRVREVTAVHPLVDLFIAHAELNMGKLRLGVPAILMTNRFVADRDRGHERNDWTLLTSGLNLKAEGDLFWRIEAYAQTQNERLGYLFAGYVGCKVLSWLKPALGIDYLSGTRMSPRAHTGAFDTLFATSHGTYGMMDRFVDIPADTKNGGLVDYAVKNQGTVGPGSLEIGAHEFALATRDSAGNSALIGAEVDAVYDLPIMDEVSAQLGGGLFFDQGDFRQTRQTADLRTWHDWVYVQIDLKL